MDIATAEQASALLPQIKTIESLVADLQRALKEHWPIMSMRMVVPDVVIEPQGTPLVPGTQVDLLPFGNAPDDLSQQAITTLLTAYEAKLADLQAQLAAL